MKEQEIAGDRAILISRETLFGRPGGQFWQCLVGRCLLLLAYIVPAVFAGCIVIPTPEHTLLEGRGEIGESDIAFLEKSKTTREDVVLRYGEPDLVLHDQHTLVYHWKIAHGYCFIAGYNYSAAGGVIPKDYLFMLEFDEEGRLKRFERSGSIWRSAKSRLDEWTPPGSEKLTPKDREIIMIDPIPEAPAQPRKRSTSTRSVRFRVGEFRQLRPDPNTSILIGHKKAAFGVIVADVWISRPPIDIVRASVTAQLEAAGHHLVDRDAEVTVTGEIVEFGVKTSISVETWDANGSLDVTVKVHPSPITGETIIRRYQAKHVVKTSFGSFGPSKEHFEKVMRACLEDMQRQMASDLDFVRLLKRNQPRPHSSD